MIPYISKFAGTLIRPLLGELIHHPQQPSNYNKNIIRRFLPKFIKNTHLETPTFQREIESTLDRKQYSKTIDYINGAQRGLAPTNFELHKALKQIDWVHADSFRLVNRTKELLQDLTRTLDELF